MLLNDTLCDMGKELANLISKLGEYRLKHQLTQAQLAEKLGVSRITLNRWLNGGNEPRPLELHRIKELLSEK